jgi:hydrogenase expression/formation protein HypC
MCLAIPMKIQKIEAGKGLVEIGGIQRQIGLDLLTEVHVGDYVIVHAGFAIQKLDEKEALETLAIIAEMERLA